MTGKAVEEAGESGIVQSKGGESSGKEEKDQQCEMQWRSRVDVLIKGLRKGCDAFLRLSQLGSALLSPS